jgi:hypothetical protein
MEILMSASTSSTGVNTSAFWEQQWRMSGIVFAVLFIVAYVVYGDQPRVGASADALTAFYGGHRTRILIAVVFSGIAVLYLLWLAAAIRTTLADAGQDGWGAAATAASAVVAALFLLLIMVAAALTYAIASSGNLALISGLNDVAWVGVVLRLTMAAAFGMWRAGMISNALFAVGVAAVVLTFLGGTTWLSDGFWAPDGAYSRFLSPIIGLVWVLVVSRVLLTESPATRAGW